jgi:hypothetical protein
MERLHDLGVAKDKRNKELMDMMVVHSNFLMLLRKELDELKVVCSNPKTDKAVQSNPKSDTVALLGRRRSERLARK